MGKYLDIIRRSEAEQTYDINDINDQSPVGGDFGRICRFGRNCQAASESAPYARTMAALRERCPDLIEVERWRQAVADGERFLAQWGEQVAVLGWTAGDLFGLTPVPDHAKPSFNRLSRYDHTGLCWLLEGRSVTAMSSTTAAIANPSGTVTTYRKHHKPALGPVADSLHDLE